MSYEKKKLLTRVVALVTLSALIFVGTIFTTSPGKVYASGSDDRIKAASDETDRLIGIAERSYPEVTIDQNKTWYTDTGIASFKENTYINGNNHTLSFKKNESGEMPETAIIVRSGKTVVIKDLTIDGTGIKSHVIDVKEGGTLVLINVTITGGNGRHGISLSQGTAKDHTKLYARNTTISNCGMTGVTAWDNTEFYLEGCTFDNNGWNPMGLDGNAEGAGGFPAISTVGDNISGTVNGGYITNGGGHGISNGDNMNGEVHDGSGDILCAGVKISGNNYSGICTWFTATTTLENCDLFENHVYGIELANKNPVGSAATNVYVNNCNIRENGVDGVRAWNRSRVVVKDSNIFKNGAKQTGHGISVMNDSDANVEGGTISENRNGGCGAYVEGNGKLTLNNVTIENNTGNGAETSSNYYNQATKDEYSLVITGGSIRNNSGNGIKSSGSSAARIDSASVSGNNANGVWACGSSSIEVNRCTIEKNSGDGVTSDDTATLTVNNSDVKQNTGCGARAYKNSKLNIHSGSVHDNAGDGALATDNAGLVITDSNVYNNTGCGIAASGSSSVSVTGGSASSNGINGIAGTGSSVVTATSVTINNNRKNGVVSIGTDNSNNVSNVTLTGCTVKGNSEDGVMADNKGIVNIAGGKISSNSSNGIRAYKNSKINVTSSGDGSRTQITSNGFQGVWVLDSASADMTNADVTGNNSLGFLADGNTGSSSTLNGVNVSGNGSDAVKVAGGAWLKITGGNISSNTDDAIYIARNRGNIEEAGVTLGASTQISGRIHLSNEGDGASDKEYLRVTGGAKALVFKIDTVTDQRKIAVYDSSTACTGSSATSADPGRYITYRDTCNVRICSGHTVSATSSGGDLSVIITKNGGTLAGNGNVQWSPVFIGETVTFMADRNGKYVFSAWYEGSTKITNESTVNYTLTAHNNCVYTAHSYENIAPDDVRVQFNGNGKYVQGSKADIVKHHSENLTLDPNTSADKFVRPGYRFVHWSDVAGRAANGSIQGNQYCIGNVPETPVAIGGLSQETNPEGTLPNGLYRISCQTVDGRNGLWNDRLTNYGTSGLNRITIAGYDIIPSSQFALVYNQSRGGYRVINRETGKAVDYYPPYEQAHLYTYALNNEASQYWKIEGGYEQESNGTWEYKGVFRAIDSRYVGQVVTREDPYLVLKSYTGVNDLNKFTFYHDGTIITNMVLYAQWEPYSYKIKYNPNGGNGSTVDTGKMSYNDEANYYLRSDKFTRTGYSQDGWMRTSNGSTKEYGMGETISPSRSEDFFKYLRQTDGTVVPSKDNDEITLFAHWVPNKVKIKVRGINCRITGTSDFDMTYDTGNYSVIGWSLLGVAPDTDYVVKDFTLKDKNGSVVYLYSNGTLSANTANTTYWDSSMNWKYAGTEDVELFVTAALNAAAYKVEHYKQNVSGDDCTLSDTDTGLSGIIGSTPAYTKRNYTGFYFVTATTPVIAADGSTVVRVYYNRNTHSVTLGAGIGISGVSGAGTYRYGANVTIDASVADGYSWAEWTEWTGTSKTSVKKYTFIMPDSDVAFTAKASPNVYSVTFNPNGGTIDGTVQTPVRTIAFNTFDFYSTAGMDNPLWLSKDRTKWTGHTLLGWYANNSDNSKEDGRVFGTAAERINSSVLFDKDGRYIYVGNPTVYAHWSLSEYTLYFDYNRPAGASHRITGNTIYEKKVTYSKKTGELPAPQLTGWKFMGWKIIRNGAGTDINKDSVWMYDSSMTAVAQWEPVSYEVRLHKNPPAVALGTINCLNPSGWQWDEGGYYHMIFTYDTDNSLPVPQDTYSLIEYSISGWYKNVLLSSYTGYGNNRKWNLTATDGAVVNLYPSWIDTSNPKIIVTPEKTINPNADNDAVRSLTVTISVSENGSGLSDNNIYEYGLSTSADTAPAKWEQYYNITSLSGFTIPLHDIGSSMNGRYYLWVRQIYDRSGNSSESPTALFTLKGCHVFGIYVFDNTAPDGKTEYIENNLTLGLYNDTVTDSPYAVMTIHDPHDDIAGIEGYVLRISDANAPSNSVDYSFTPDAGTGTYTCSFNLYDSLPGAENIEKVHLQIIATDRLGNEATIPITRYDFGTLQTGVAIGAEDIGYRELPDITDASSSPLLTSYKYIRDYFRVEAYIENISYKASGTTFMGGHKGQLRIYVFGYVDNVSADFGSVKKFIIPEYDTNPDLSKTGIVPPEREKLYLHEFFVPLYCASSTYTDTTAFGYKGNSVQKRSVIYDVSDTLAYKIKTILKYNAR